jgi:hypothetical protein
MALCPKCGAKIKEDDKFCPHCGEPLAAKTSEQPMKESYARERDICFGGGERRPDHLGFVSFGIFLLIVGVIFVANPNMVSDFRLWIERLASEKALSRPPQGLITSATLFFGLIGLSDFFMVGIRLMTVRAGRRALSDVLSGIALLSFSYLISLYGGHALTWQMVLAIEAIVCGLLIILYSAIRYLFLAERRQTVV